MKALFNSLVASHQSFYQPKSTQTLSPQPKLLLRFLVTDQWIPGDLCAWLQMSAPLVFVATACNHADGPENWIRLRNESSTGRLQIVFFAKLLQKRRNRLGPCQQVRLNSVKYMVFTLAHIPLGFIFDDLAQNMGSGN